MKPLPNPGNESLGTEGNALALRRRSVWEAADSGVLLWRANFIYFIPFFALPVWIVACGLRLLPGNYFYLSYLVLWWLKPFFGRLVLHVVSLRFFNDSLSRSKDLCKGLWGTISRCLLGDLLWRRFSLGRGSRTPVRVLERINRKQYAQRKKILAQGGLNFCSLLSILFFFLEISLLLGEFFFIMTLTQLIAPSALEVMRHFIEAVEIYLFAAFCLNYILVESLYVCMGFGIYINSRVEVEGWDLQILFKKFAGAAGIIFICFFLFLPRPLISDSGNSGDSEINVPELEFINEPSEKYDLPFEYFPEGFPFVNPESLDVLEKILASPDFGKEEKTWGIRLKNEPESHEMPNIDFAPWMYMLRELFGYLLRFFAILVIGAFIFLCFFWFRKYYKKNMKPSGKGSYTRANPFLSPEDPESLFTKAEYLLSNGFIHDAWAACLSGCLGSYTRYRSLHFPADATEYDCLELVRRALPVEAESFSDLVGNWILLAYGGRVPERGFFDQALSYGRSIRDRA